MVQELGERKDDEKKTSRRKELTFWIGMVFKRKTKPKSQISHRTGNHHQCLQIPGSTPWNG